MRTLVLPLLALAGCGTQIGTETGFGCLVDSTETVSDPSLVPTGFTTSVEDAQARLTGSWDGTLSREDDVDVALTLVITATGDAVVERRSWRSESSDGGPEPAIAAADCPDRIRIPARIEVDAAPDLAEVVDASVEHTADDRGAFGFRVDLADLDGTASPLGFDPSTMVDVQFSMSGSRTETGWHGEASFLGESPPSGTGPDAAVTATIDPYGSWTADGDDTDTDG